jgi:hypothetical protein
MLAGAPGGWYGTSWLFWLALLLLLLLLLADLGKC